MSRLAFATLSFLLLALFGCRDQKPNDHGPNDHGPDDHGPSNHGQGHATAEDTAWSVTAWSEHYELFAETDGLVAGLETPSHAHFTYLPDFSALNQGSVAGILRGEGGLEERFLAPLPLRAGIFKVPFKPSRPGTYALSFQVDNGLAREEIAAGRVEVGTEGHPGGLVEPPAGAPQEGGTGQEVGFLKEQQWRTPFATAWVGEGALRLALRAAGRVRPAAGGEALLVAPVDGVVQAEPWPRPGDGAKRGARLFQIAPKITGQESAAQRGAAAAALEAEHRVAAERLRRLRQLLALEATSRREVEEAEALETALAARLDAARRDQAAAEAQRGGGAESFRVVSPIAGRVVEVAVSPGQFVAAGTLLARLVASSPVWLELALSPEQAAQVGRSGAPAGLTVRRWAGEEPFALAADELRLVTLSPEIDAATGTVTALLELARDVDQLKLGSRVEAELLLPEELRGIVLPGSAVVDDSGVAVVYVQLGGESFERREVVIAARQGSRVLLRGVGVGERVVVLGGNAIRRSALLGSGAVEGHVH